MANRQQKDSKRLLVTLCLLLFSVTLIGLSCVDKKQKGPAGPAGYDLNKPKQYSMPDILQEISGFAFDKGDNRFVYAQQDEDGVVFKLPLGTKDETKTKFAGKGDYEDIAILGGKIIMLKSNGTLYTFPISETQKKEATGVITTKDLLPKAEYEGMHADESKNKVYVLCKNCDVDKGTKNYNPKYNRQFVHRQWIRNGRNHQKAAPLCN